MVRAVAILRLIRMPGCVTAAADSVTAALCVTAVLGLGADPARLALLGLASFCLYAFGIALGDLLDVAKDRELHPDRPIPTGAVPPGAARLVVAATLVAGVGLASALGRTPMLFSGLTAAMVLLHLLLLKRNDVTATLGMAGCRVLNLLLGASVVGAVSELPVLLPVATGTYVLALTGISAFEERRRPRAVLVMLTHLLLIAVLLPFPAFPERGAPLVTAVPLFVVLAWRAGPAWLRTGPATVGALVGRAVLGILLLDAAYLFGFGFAPEAAVVGVLYLALRLLPRPAAGT
jgi:4-hydroxybenzoate polyprenyltransferase